MYDFCLIDVYDFYIKTFKGVIQKKAWQLPTFPLKSSIIGVRELDFRVRDGNGWVLSAITTEISLRFIETIAYRERIADAFKI